MKKKLIIIVTCVLILAGALFAAFKLGAFVYPYNMSALTEVPEYDIVEEQFAREQEILADYSQADYSMDDPYVILDPYNFNPLSALVMFGLDKDSEVVVAVQGDDEYSTYTYTHKALAPNAEIPVIGLYAGRENNVTLTLGGVSHTLKITTEPLPVDFQEYTLEASQPEKMEPGVTLFTACFEHSYNALLDNNAQVRGYLSDKRMAHGTSMIVLKNGNMLSTGNEYKQIPYNMASLFEYNWLGKIYRVYEIPNAVHHNINELPNGDILAVSNNERMFQTGTREDVVIIIDRQTGEVKKTYDFRNIIDETREPYHHFHPNVINPPNVDWMHTNAAIYDETHNAIIVSSPTQSMVISIDADTSEINWILGPHEGYEGSSGHLKQYLLEPVGGDFEWQWCQHYPTIIESTADSITLMVFDNGQSKSFFEETSVAPEDNYSRAVIYRIDLNGRTAEQLWQYGKERGSECYATFLGSAIQMQNGNILITFGGQLRADGVPVDDIVDGVVEELAINSRVVEVSMDGEVIYEVSGKDTQYTTSAETYQARRMELYSPESFGVRMGTTKGERLGRSYACTESVEIPVPPLRIGKLSAEFNRIYNENDRLIIDGVLLCDGRTYLLARAGIVLRSKNDVFVYDTFSSLNGRFFLSLDLNELPTGEYQIDIGGAVIEGNNTQTGKRIQGSFKTGYKVMVG